MLASPQCCHGVAQLMYDSAEQQGDEEVGQLAGGQIDARDLKRHPRREKDEQHTTVTGTQQENQQSTSGGEVAWFSVYFLHL